MERRRAYLKSLLPVTLRVAKRMYLAIGIAIVGAGITGRFPPFVSNADVLIRAALFVTLPLAIGLVCGVIHNWNSPQRYRWRRKRR
ncbi:hypothetical protein [Stakelama tenebrarum]|uniref:Uncharacterized protein n=1 Tax=Stakelama tenebrarum TaxID=2711215 RepID=A0A6G6Y8N2_9SPHN|nr:hypothetical protein [Sphingosinithalassobacter tenebrarum]QIG81270.1 hypothetical protein G5C33_16775 [Sphingosinithalassobacter tenebrarum]